LGISSASRTKQINEILSNVDNVNTKLLTVLQQAVRNLVERINSLKKLLSFAGRKAVTDDQQQAQRQQPSHHGVVITD
jgi:hypothetical protein